MDSSVDSRGVGTLDHLNLLTTLAEDEGWHGGDTVLGGDWTKIVNVDLVEAD